MKFVSRDYSIDKGVQDHKGTKEESFLNEKKYKITKERVVGEYGTAVRQGSSLPFSALLGAPG